MNKTLFILFFLCLNILLAQEISLENRRDNIMYRGVHNPVSALIENVDCDSIFLKVPDAKILSKRGCFFNIVPISDRKEIDINFYKITNKDTVFIKKRVLRVRDVPNPTFVVAGRNEGKMKVSYFKTLSIASFNATSDSSFFCMSYYVEEFKMIVLRNNTSVGVSKNIGRRASLETKELIQKVKPGDIVYILDIKCEFLNNIVELDPAKFEIIE